MLDTLALEQSAARSISAPLSLLAASLADPTAQWSVGTFGAIAEFLRDPDEWADVSPLSVVTQRGALCLTPRDGLKLVAFETTTRDSWSARVALCLPAEAARMSMRTVLTELGPDLAAPRVEDRAAVLFDVGIGARQLDLCVRVADPDLVRQLRAECGKPTFSHESQAGRLILTHSPHRVFVTPLARAEVYLGIPPADGKSPDGPHTHVLFDLLRHKRTHAATEPIPQGYIPCAHLYPAHPAKDAQGFRQPYLAERKDAFDRILTQFGDERTLRFKQEVLTAIAMGLGPTSVRPADRFARTTARVALRQLRAVGADAAPLAEWVAAFEPRVRESAENDRHVHHR